MADEKTNAARVSLRVAVPEDVYDRFKKRYAKHGMASIVINELIEQHLDQLDAAEAAGKLIPPLPLSLSN